MFGKSPVRSNSSAFDGRAAAVVGSVELSRWHRPRLSCPLAGRGFLRIMRRPRAATRSKTCGSSWLNPGVFAPESSGRSRSSSARSRNTGRRSMSATRSCTTGTWSSGCAPRARASSTISPRSRRAASPSSARTACRARSRTTPRTAHLPVIDATCPLVSKVHSEGQRYAAQDREIVLIGHARPSRDRRHDGPNRRQGAPHLQGRGGRLARGEQPRQASPTSPRRRFRSTTRGR